MSEFRHWIAQALDEIQDLRDAIDFDEEYLGDAGELLEPLESALRKLGQEAASDDYTFGAGDLPFMGLVNHYDENVLPLRPLLLRINETHTQGLDNVIG